MKVGRKVLGEFVGYVVDIMPYMKWGKLLYSIKIMMMGLSSLASQNLEELPDWLWYGSAVKATVSSHQHDDVVKFSADNLSPNEQLPSIQPVQISVLNFDAQTGELTVRREFSRMLTLKVSEEHVRNELLTSSGSDFYALFLDNPKGFKIIGLVRSSRYRLLSRARELARIVVE